MSFIQSLQNPVRAASAHIKLSAGADLLVKKTISGRANIELSASGNLSQTNLLEAGSNISLTASGFLRIDNEPNLFLAGAASIKLTANLGIRTARILQADPKISLSASGALTNQQAERADAVFSVQIVPVLASQNYQNPKFKFSAGGVEVKIRSFKLDYPRGSVGTKFSVEPANAARNQFDPNTSFKFEYDLGFGFVTVFDTAKLDSENISSRFFDDRISLDISTPLTDKFLLSPRKSKIYYDPSKTDVEIDEQQQQDVLTDTFGKTFPASKQAVNNLSLSYLLTRAFVEGCGFSSVVTNIPNYEITRADFSTNSTYKDAIAPFLGMFEPVFFEAGNVLYILDTSNVLPAGFAPRTITASKFTNFSSSAQKRIAIDGYDVQFSDSVGDYHTERQLPLKIEKSGTYGNYDYSEVHVLTTIREYRSFDNPSVILRNEIKESLRKTYNFAGIVTDEETFTKNFDSNGRLYSAVKRIKQYLPNLNDNGNPLLQTARTESTVLTYEPNPKNFREMSHVQTKTFVSGLIAVDSENQYFGRDFEQDFLKAHEAGNLNENMSSRFGSLYTITEYFEDNGKGQTEIRREITDHLRGVNIDPQTDIRGGTNSFNQFQTARSVRVWREGADRNADKGANFETLSAGELPSRMAIALAERKLKKQSAKNQTGTFDLIGIDEGLRRGSTAKILDRWNNPFGNFLIEGVSITGTFGANPSIATQITAREI